MHTKFGVDSLSRFSFGSQTDTHTDQVTDVTDHSTHASTTAGVMATVVARRSVIIPDLAGDACERQSHDVHCEKNPYIHGYFAASFPYTNGTGSVYVCIRKTTLQCGPALHYFVDLRMRAYTEAVPLKHGKLVAKCPWIYGHFSRCRFVNYDRC